MKENKIEKLILDLSNRWDCSPQEAVDRLNSMDESEINKLINSMTKKFEMGGSLPKAKFENGGMIDCLRNGGSFQKCKCGDKVAKGKDGMVTDGDWDDYHTMINAPGDTLRFKQYYSGPAEMRTVPGKGIKYSRTVGNYKQNWYSPGYKSGPVEKLWMILNGYTEVPKSEVENWKELIYNHRNDPAVKDKTQKKKCGGPLPKKSKFKK